MLGVPFRTPVKGHLPYAYYCRNLFSLGLYPAAIASLSLNSEQRIPSDSIVLPVNNFGANYLQLSVCSKGVSAAKLTHFGQVFVNLQWFATVDRSLFSGN